MNSLPLGMGVNAKGPLLYPPELLGHMVRTTGVEPVRIAPPGFKSGASASFTTPAYRGPPPNGEAGHPPASLWGSSTS